MNDHICTKCSGTGQYRHFGTCFRCNGTGGHAKPGRKGPKYQIGDRIRSNQTNKIFEVKGITSRSYTMDKYSPDGKTLLSDLGKLGRHIDKYTEDDPKGYTLIKEEPEGEKTTFEDFLYSLENE